MRFKVGTILAASILVSTAAFSAEGDAEKGKRVFNKCKACHKVGEKAKKGVGPILNDIIEAKAGAQEGYKYSRALREAGENGLIWTDEKLHAYLKKPKDLVPKGKMQFPGLKKESDRANVIAYLKKFSKPKEDGDKKPEEKPEEKKAQ